MISDDKHDQTNSFLTNMVKSMLFWRLFRKYANAVIFQLAKTVCLLLLFLLLLMLFLLLLLLFCFFCFVFFVFFCLFDLIQHTKLLLKMISNNILHGMPLLVNFSVLFFPDYIDYLCLTSENLIYTGQKLYSVVLSIVDIE